MRIVNPTAKKGEQLASEFLTKKGYRIVDRNFRKGYGEIDIIAVHEQTLVFVEVKTRTSTLFGTPLEAITYWKLKTLIKTAQLYKLLHPNLPDSMRIDAVSVILDQGKADITLHKNIGMER